MSKHPAAACSEVRASRFVLVDPGGRERAVLELEHDQPVLRLVGSNGRVQIQVGIAPDGTTRVYLEGPDQGSALGSFASVAAGPAGVATVEFGASRRRVRASSRQAGDTPSLILTDDHGQVVAELPANPSRG